MSFVDKLATHIWCNVKALICINILLFSSNLTAQQETITIANGEWFPYTSASLKGFGALSEIVSQAYASQGIKVKYEFLPWARTFRDTEMGKYVASVAWSYKEEWAENFIYSNSLIESRKVLFFNHNKPFTWQSYNDLKNKKIAVINSYTYGDKFDQFANKNENNVSKLVREEQALKMLALGRIDAFASDIIVGYAYTAKLFRPELKNLITHHPKPLDVTTLHVIFSKKIPREKTDYYLNKLNKGLKLLEENGQLEALKLKAMMAEY